MFWFLGDMEQGYLCISTDPRRVGAGGGETVILNPRELRKVITLQQTTEVQKIWMTSAQTGFPLERDTDEGINIKDVQMGRNTVRYLHPAISTYITVWEADLTSGSPQSAHHLQQSGTMTHPRLWSLVERGVP